MMLIQNIVKILLWESIMWKEVLFEIENDFLHHDFCIKKLIDKYNCCYSELYEHFYSKFNIPPSKYVENKRLDYTLELLANNQTIVIIAKKCGYANSRTFRTAFKKRFNISPSQMKNELNKMNDIKKYTFITELKKQLWKNDEYIR
jgi:AraC-like DNA-binding protein